MYSINLEKKIKDGELPRITTMSKPPKEKGEEGELELARVKVIGCYLMARVVRVEV